MAAASQGGFVLGLELPDGDRFYDDKADVLELNGLAEASSFLLRADREPPEQLLGFLRLLNLAGARRGARMQLSYQNRACDTDERGSGRAGKVSPVRNPQRVQAYRNALHPTGPCMRQLV